jgi:signal transduction histidine kinase
MVDLDLSLAEALEQIGCQLANGVRYIERCRNLQRRYPDEVEADLERATGSILDAALAARRLRAALDESTAGHLFPHIPAFADAATDVGEPDDSDPQEDVEAPTRRRSTPEERLIMRIVRDALVDICLHGSGTFGRLEVVRGDGMVRLTVEDGNVLGVANDRAVGSSAGASADVTGLRARTAILGGQLNAHRLDGCGLKITARIPLAHVLADAAEC